MKSDQRRLYALLPMHARCFVRICDDERALWVSDLPRKCETHQALLPVLEAAGFDAQLDEKSRLWYIDWTHKRWNEVIEECIREIPTFPKQECFHVVYALCRILLMHPAVLQKEHLPFLRRVLKALEEQESKRTRLMKELYEETAKQLRNGQTPAYAAGRVLAQWLWEQEQQKELQP